MKVKTQEYKQKLLKQLKTLFGKPKSYLKWFRSDKVVQLVVFQVNYFMEATWDNTSLKAAIDIKKKMRI